MFSEFSKLLPNVEALVLVSIVWLRMTQPGQILLYWKYVKLVIHLIMFSIYMNKELLKDRLSLGIRS